MQIEMSVSKHNLECIILFFVYRVLTNVAKVVAVINGEGRHVSILVAFAEAKVLCHPKKGTARSRHNYHVPFHVLSGVN